MGARIAAVAVLVAALAAAVLGSVAVAEQGGVVARNPYPFPVALSTPRGLVVVEPGGDAPLDPGVVCVASPRVYYSGDGIRYSLAGLLVDGVLKDSPCAEARGVVEPFYTLEYRVLLVSRPPGIVYRELWGPAGSAVTVEAPGLVEDEFTRYALEGLVLPGGFQVRGPRVQVALHSPLLVEAVYRAEYRVIVEGVGSEYWYSSGPLLIPVEDVTVVRGGVRLVPVKLVAGNAEIEARNGYFIVPEGFKGVLKPIFKKEYLLVVKGPGGEKREWLEEGSSRIIEFPGVVEVSPEERLIYRGALLDGVRVAAPRVEVVADSPHTVEALYNRQYLVRVTSIMGTTEEWVLEGSLYTLSLPREIPGGLFTRLEMTAVIVNGEYLPGVEALRIPVEGPLHITVVYSPTPILWRLALATVPVTLLSASAALYLYQWLSVGGQRSRG